MIDVSIDNTWHAYIESQKNAVQKLRGERLKLLDGGFGHELKEGLIINLYQKACMSDSTVCVVAHSVSILFCSDFNAQHSG